MQNQNNMQLKMCISIEYDQITHVSFGPEANVCLGWISNNFPTFEINEEEEEDSANEFKNRAPLWRKKKYVCKRISRKHLLRYVQYIMNSH